MRALRDWAREQNEVQNHNEDAMNMVGKGHAWLDA